MTTRTAIKWPVAAVRPAHRSKPTRPGARTSIERDFERDSEQVNRLSELFFEIKCQPRRELFLKTCKRFVEHQNLVEHGPLNIEVTEGSVFDDFHTIFDDFVRFDLLVNRSMQDRNGNELVWAVALYMQDHELTSSPQAVSLIPISRIEPS